MKNILSSVGFHFALAFIVRLVFTFYGLFHDAYCEQSTENCPKYTDYDYRVFTDAANYVYEVRLWGFSKRCPWYLFNLLKGKSPYDRETYRYTPLLAIMLQPNIWLWKGFGKLVFIAFDLLCGLAILKINTSNRLASICFWFYNPITIIISSRGSAESIMSFIVLAFLWSFEQRNYFQAGFLYALAIHFKIYPLIYSLAIVFNLCNSVSEDAGGILSKVWVLLQRALKFGVTFIGTLTALTYYFYYK